MRSASIRSGFCRRPFRVDMHCRTQRPETGASVRRRLSPFGGLAFSGCPAIATPADFDEGQRRWVPDIAARFRDDEQDQRCTALRATNDCRGLRWLILRYRFGPRTTAAGFDGCCSVTASGHERLPRTSMAIAPLPLRATNDCRGLRWLLLRYRFGVGSMLTARNSASASYRRSPRMVVRTRRMSAMLMVGSPSTRIRSATKPGATRP